MVEKKKRNNMIDLFKLVLSFVIVLYHISLNIDGFTIFNRGLLAVDFFFIVSGYFFVISVLKDKKYSDDNHIYEDNVKLILRKYKSFFPYLFVGFVLSLLYRIILDNIGVHTILNSIFTLLLVHMAGLPVSKVNNVVWYLSVMLLSMFIIYPLIRKQTRKYCLYLAPIFVIIGLGLFNNYFVNFNSYLQYKFVFNASLRGFIDINIGIVLYYLVDYFKNKEFSIFGKAFATFLELLGWVFMIILMTHQYYKLDIFSIFVWFILMFIALSNLSYTSKIAEKIRIKKVDKLSLAIYCIHIPCIVWCRFFAEHYIHISGYNLGLLILLITVVFSIILVFVVDKTKNIKVFSKLLLKNS